MSVALLCQKRLEPRGVLSPQPSSRRVSRDSGKEERLNLGTTSELKDHVHHRVIPFPCGEGERGDRTNLSL